MRPLKPREMLFSALSGGFGAGILFCLGFILPGFVFLALLPLMMVGFAQGARQARIACGITCVTVGVIGSPADAIFFLCLFALPVHYFIQQALLWRGPENARTWYPMLRLMCELTIMAAAYFMVLAFWTEELGGLQPLVKKLSDTLQLPDPEVSLKVKQLGDDWGYGVLASVGWVWVIMFYGLAVLSNAIVRFKGLALRPSLALETDGLTRWLLFLTVLSGLFALAGKGMDRYTAQTIFLVLLLPYFLCGLVFVHLYSLRRQLFVRRTWIFLFYFALIMVTVNSGLWLVILLILVGLYFQVSEILDRWKKMR